MANPDAVFDAREPDRNLARRADREPLAYVVGYREFYGRRFSVDPGVLVPRQETETLVEEVLARLSSAESARVLEVGVGSGCVLTTLALERPDFEYWGCDLSGDAVATARENARVLGASANLLVSDFFENLPDIRFDAIVSNPPYVSSSDRLSPEVALFEPAIALYADENGLGFFRRLATEARPRLDPAGFLAVEIGDGQGSGVRDVFAVADWSEAGSRSDLSGTERVLVFRDSR